MIEDLKKVMDIVDGFTFDDWRDRAKRMEATNLIKGIIKELEKEVK
jgi:hypothetical protein